MINESLKKLLKIGGMDNPSEEDLRSLCFALVRSGYYKHTAEDEDVNNIFAVVCEKGTDREMRTGGGWTGPGRGYRYELKSIERIVYWGQKHWEKRIVRLCVPSPDLVVGEYECSYPGREKMLEKIEQLERYREYLKLKKELEG